MYLTENPENGRGCGKRDEGDIYGCVGLSARGYPIEYFLRDPVEYIPWQRGVVAIPKDPNNPEGVHDVLCFIGRDPKQGETEGYPSMWSFARETGKFGLSRKFPKNFPFHLIERGSSKVKLVHPHAIPIFDYQVNQDRPYHYCKKFNKWANNREWWDRFDFGHHLLDQAKPDTLGESEKNRIEKCTHAMADLSCLDHFADEVAQANIGQDDEFQVEMPSFSFFGTWPKSVDFDNIDWLPGIFMELPLTHFEIPHKDTNNSVQKLNKHGWDAVVTGW